ncbi:MAG: Ig-like domain-containing protein, partial [Rhizobacter sp.]
MKLIVKYADGTQKIIETQGNEPVRLAAKPGMTLHPVDAKTGKTSANTLVKRVDDDLVIEDGTVARGTARVEGFFDECKPSDRCWAVLDVPEGAIGGGNGGGQVTITQDSSNLNLLGNGLSGGMGMGQELAFAHVAPAAAAAGVGFGALGWVAGGVAVAGVAAGGGGGGGGGGGAPAPGPLTVRGEVAAGPVKTGTVDVYVYDKDGVLLGHALVHNDTGEYEIVIPGKGNYTGPLLLVARDADGPMADNYLDEATNQWTNLGDSLGAIGAATSPLAIINITPLTQLATLKMGVDVNAVNATNRPPADMAWIAVMNKAIGDYFGVADILGPVVTINEAGFRSADPAAAAYGVALARLSEMDMRTGSLHASLVWLDSVLTMTNDGTISTADNSLNFLDTDRTIARADDVAAALSAASASSLLSINLANVNMTRVVIALPVNAVAGDLVNVTLAGPNGTATLAAHTVTAQDLAQGYAAIPVDATVLAGVGPGHVVPTAIVTDAAGDNASPSYQGTAFDSDLVAPAPQLALSGNNVIPASANSVAVTVQYAGMAAGDTVRLQLDGQDLGIEHVVTQTEANAGTLSVSVDKSALGADGNKTITATATDVAGNAGNTSGAGSVTVTLDTSAPIPVMALQAGQDSSVHRHEPRVNLEVSYAGLAEGDTIQLRLAGNDLGTPHTVTADEVNAGRATISVAQADLGADGPKNITAIATDAAGNAGTTVPLTLVLDTVAPAPQLALAAGHDAVLNAADTNITLDLQYAGMTAGDRVQLGLSGASLGSLYTVTTADVNAGLVAFNVNKSALGADGVKNIAAQVTDAAGNAGTSSALQVTLDTSAPVPTLAIATGHDAIVNATETGIDVVISYPGLVAGDVVQLRLAGGNLGTPHTVTTGDVTTGSVTLTIAKADLGVDGNKAVTVNVTDIAGNTGTSPALAITLDSLAAVPTLTIAAGEDRYLNAAETSVHLEVSFAGMAAGNTIQLQLDGSHFGTPYVVTNNDVTAGYATITVQRADLAGDGATLAAVVASGTAGNAGSSNPIALIVDTSVPAPTLAIQAGEDARLGIAESVLHLQVRDADLKVGDVVQLQLGGSNLGAAYTVTTADVNSGFATLTVQKADLGADGGKNLTVTVTDLAGNSGASPILAVTLDSIAPTPTLVVQAGHNLLLNAGEALLPLQLSDANLAEGDVVRLSLNGQSLGSPYTVTAADVTAGFATLNVSRASLGADGAKNIVASLTDTAGNAGTSNTLAVTLDTAVPAPALALAAGEDGVLNAIESAVHLSVTYAGMAAGDTLQMRLAGNVLGAPYTVTANDVTAGRVLLDVARTDLGADGLKNLAVTATDVAGNSAASNGIAVTLDTTAPVPTLSVAPGQDSILNATETGVLLRVAYTGLAAGDVVQLNFAGNALGAAHTVTAGEATSGYVSLNVAKADLGADGAKSLTVTATDVAGNSATSSALSLTLDSVAAVPTLSFAPGQDGLLGTADTSVEVQVSFAGMAAGNSVQLRLAGVDFGAPYTVTAGNVTAGYATLSVSRGSLGADGSKSISVIATGTAGNAGASNALDVVVDTTAPTPTLTIATGEDNLLGAAESVLHVRASYAGLAAGDVIQLELAGFAFGGTYTVSSADVTAGYATLSVSRASLGGDGVKSLTITATDLAGNSGSSSPLAVTLDSVGPTPVLAIAAGSDDVVNTLESGLPVQVSYAGMAAGDVVQLQLAGSNVGVAYTVTSGDVTAGFAALTVAKASLGSDGTKSLTAIATDAAGNPGTSATLSVLLDTTAPTVQFSNQTGALLTGAGLGLLGNGNAGVALVDGASTVSDGSSVAVGRVVLSLSGFADGANERLSIGNATLRGDGSATPATVTAGGTTWSVSFANGAFTFTPANGSASQADVAALMQASYNDLASTITDGQRIVSYTLTDTHGNVGNTVTSSVLVSTTPPSITAAITALSADTGTLGDFITTTAAQSVGGSYSGTFNSGDRIQVSLDGSTWVDATITGASTWVANGITLQSGSHNLYVRAINLAGNASTPATHAYTLESVVIATTAAITAAWDDAGINSSSTGLLGSGHSTDDTTPTLTGTVSQALASGQVVALYDNGTRIGEATVNGTNWTYAVTSPLSTGTNNLVAVIEHPASGAHSAHSNTYVIDQQSISLSVLDDVGGQHGAITLGGATDDNLPHLTGTLGFAVLG